MKNIFNLMKTSQYPSGSDEGKEKVSFGDTVHIECINKTGVVVKIHENVLGIDTTYFVKFPDGTIGNFGEESVELVSHPDTGVGDGGEYETESFDQLSGSDLVDTAGLLTVLSQSGMSTEEMAQKTDISPDAIKDILDWYDTDPEDRDLFEPKTKRT